MEPEAKPDARDADNARPVPDTSAAEAALKAKLSRKRTKTGCLTCRRRRIKCGEERPLCKNCIKSKRHCEGYSQRVVFKPPTFDYQTVPNGGAHITFQAGPVLAQATPDQAEPQASRPDSTAYTLLRPRTTDPKYVTVYDTQSQQYVTIPQPPQQSSMHNGASQTPHGHVSPQQTHFFQPGYSPAHPQQHFHAVHFPVAPQHVSMSSHAPVAYPAVPIASMPAPHHDVGAVSNFQDMSRVAVPTGYVAEAYGEPITRGRQPPTAPDRTPQNTSRRSTQDFQEVKVGNIVDQDYPTLTPASSHSSRTLSFSQNPVVSAQQQQWSTNVYVPRPELSRPIEYQPFTDSRRPVQFHQLDTDHSAPSLPDHSTPVSYDYDAHALQYVTPTSMLSAAAVERLDDDYYDVHSDEEMEDIDVHLGQQHSSDRQTALSRILALNRTGSRDLQMRRYDTFIHTGVLDHYRVEEVASPLRNPATARVFAHFISATGPSLSIFERHPRNSSVLFAKQSIPFTQQGLWTYTMPMAALRNQGLLHAMLALASLHIARLQNASVTPSMQHYAWALRRIHASVANHQKSRLKVTTIAASMLLGFYEIMTADHMKWNMHLAGSKQLFIETDFVGMTREFRRLKAERAMRYRPEFGGRLRSEEPFSQDDMLDQIPDVDESLISQFTGQGVRYDNHGQVEMPRSAMTTSLDLGKFEILKDLYWWYCKQDVYQSIVSGNPLLMDYSRWANCPPRAPLGKGDAVYGTFDHLVLLLGRIADFASRDRVRKLKQMEANGGQWRPAPGMNIPRPPAPQQQQSAPPPTPVSATNGFPGTFAPPPAKSPGGMPPNAMPQFFGMAPPPRTNVHMPSSYNPSHTIPTPQSANSPDMDFDLRVATDKALAEHGRIRSALHTFATSLGEAFEPLTPEYQTPMQTSFGTARFYRSYDIGTMWAIYNMAMIIAIRAHPHMPPAAHVAAAIAAPQTASYANEIGRIAAGIVPGPPDQALNPTLGAALCESCMASFFAAVQYQDPQQRQETVTRIFGIAKRTGWGSTELIANGCETAWVKTAEAGRGPPYQRIVRPQGYSEDPRLNGSWEHLDPHAQPEQNDDGDRRLIAKNEKARLQWAIGVMGVEDDVQKIRISD